MSGGSPRRLGVGMGAMTSPPVPPANGAPRARRAVPGLPAALVVLALLGACGREDRPPEPPAEERPDPVEAGRPLATYRISTVRSSIGDTLAIEAVAPCRVSLQIEQGGASQGVRTRDLEPGEAVRVEWGVAPVERQSGGPSGGAGSAPGPAEVSHRLRYGLEDDSVHETVLVARAKSPSPWVRVATATIPVSPRPFPQDGVALAAIGVADLAGQAGLSLVLEPTPAILGAPVGTPADALHVACLWVRVAPR